MNGLLMYFKYAFLFSCACSLISDVNQGVDFLRHSYQLCAFLMFILQISQCIPEFSPIEGPGNQLMLV